MPRIQRILHPTDFSDYAVHAFACALNLAHQYGAALDLVHVTPAFGEDPLQGIGAGSLSEEAFHAELRGRAHDRLRSLLEAYRDKAVAVRHEVLRDTKPARAIIAYAERHAVDLIVLGARGEEGTRPPPLGSVAEEVIHRAPAHVLTVPLGEGVPVACAAGPFRRLLVPFDFSLHSLEAFRVASEMAAETGGRLDLLHVVEPLPFAEALTNGFTVHDLVPDMQERAREGLEAAVARAKPRVPVEVHVREGHPTVAIVDFANRHETDLLVLGTRGLTGMKLFVLGSVTERVIRMAGAPVLTVQYRAPSAQDGPAPRRKEQAPPR